MGWCIDTARIGLNKIFKDANRKYRITHPQQPSEGVVIEHLGNRDLAVRYKIQVTELFPDFVYIDFILVQQSQEVAGQIRWDN